MTIATTTVTNSATTVYTSVGSTAVTYLTLTNETAGAISVDIHVVPSGDSVANQKLVAKSVDIAATDTYQLYAGGEKLMLYDSDIISVTANTDTGIDSGASLTTI